jgi:hypothetical protein
MAAQANDGGHVLYVARDDPFFTVIDTGREHRFFDSTGRPMVLTHATAGEAGAGGGLTVPEALKRLGEELKNDTAALRAAGYSSAAELVMEIDGLLARKDDLVPHVLAQLRQNVSQPQASASAGAGDAGVAAAGADGCSRLARLLGLCRRRR